MFLGINFTGKETDCETGYSYFGARYYDPTLLTSWTAVDPMSDKYPSLSPYNYCAWNPMKLVDPNGAEPTKQKPLFKHIGNGKFMINVDNLSASSRSQINHANEDPANWGVNSVGVNLIVGTYTSPIPVCSMPPDFVGIDRENTITTDFKHRRHVDNNGNKYKTCKSYSSCMTGKGGRAAGAFFLALDFWNTAAVGIQQLQILNDNYELRRQVNMLNVAAQLVDYGINNGYISNENAIDNNLMGMVIDYIYQGNGSNCTQAARDIGNELMKNISLTYKKTGNPINLYDPATNKCYSLLETYER